MSKAENEGWIFPPFVNSSSYHYFLKGNDTSLCGKSTIAQVPQRQTLNPKPTEALPKEILCDACEKIKQETLITEPNVENNNKVND
jgi:hypothetical protein